MNGGYVLIDGTGIDFGSLGKVDGIYSKLQKAIATGKPCYLENCKNGSSEFSPIAVYLAYSGTDIVISIGNMALTCTNADVISA